MLSPEISAADLYYFHEGKHIHAYEFMGAHQVIKDHLIGIRFTTWAPNAQKVYITGNFCNWEIKDENLLQKISENGVWSVFIANIVNKTKYKFAIINRYSGHLGFKSDPYAVTSELRPNTASIINLQTQYNWTDSRWLENRTHTDIFSSPLNIYELHLASWKTANGQFLSYRELALVLPEYIQWMGYTHIEIMPLSEHPLDASWGYQSTGFYSITSRHGDLIDLKHLINSLHEADIGVILDWVPGHFCKDEHGLANFDGSHCYEYQDFWLANNKAWGTYNFDLNKNEVKSFLISNAMYWLQEFHIDGLRVDAVSNMLYLNYGRNSGEWQANIFGGNENLAAVDFIKILNQIIKQHFPKVIIIAEESTSWPQVTASVNDGGLGFDFKWNMGWMNDTLSYMALDPIYRENSHNKINFSMMYNYTEKFILSISHDEVVHGKKSLVDKMWGDIWNKFAGLRLYITYMMGHPGKKLSFMGNEFGQFIEWREYEQLQWQIIGQYNTHYQTHIFFKQLNHFYLANKALWECDYDLSGFQWIDANNAKQSILSFVRYSKNKSQCLLFVCNFTSLVHYDYKIGVPESGSFTQVFNSDSLEFGGSGQTINELIFSQNQTLHNCEQYITIKIPPMAAIIFENTK